MYGIVLYPQTNSAAVVMSNWDGAIKKNDSDQCGKISGRR